MPRKALAWLIAADIVVLFVVAELVGYRVMPERQVRPLVLVLFITNAVVFWRLGRRHQPSADQRPLPGAVWAAAWIGVFLYTAHALIGLARVVVAPSRATAVVAVSLTVCGLPVVGHARC